MTESITLHSFGDVDRSGKVRWLAAELGLSVEERRIAPGEHRAKPYTDLNPFAQIPTVIFRGRTLIESTATCHTIAESFDSPKLWIGRGEPEREKYLFWLAVFGETLESRLVESALSKGGVLAPEYLALHEARVRQKLDAATKMLPDEGYLCGEAFTIADILAGYSLRLALRLGFVERSAYFSRLVSRDAAKTARFFPNL